MPLEVLKKAQSELLCYPGAGCSVMEMSHRTPAFSDILQKTKETLRRIMEIPPEYEILFMQGGATAQFSMAAMNLARHGDTMAYVQSGNFAAKAMEEGARWGNAVCVASSKAENYTYIPGAEGLPEGARFLHITGNNTIFGTCYNDLPHQVPACVLPDADGQAGKVPLVADWSSAILGKAIHVPDYGLIYAGAQKNMGPAGMAVVIIRKDLLERELDETVPVSMRYQVAARHDSMYNTPPTFAIYMAGLMYEWVEKQGGVPEMERRNRRKAGALYDFIDQSALFSNPVRRADRSIMNVIFTLPGEAQTKEFLDLAKSRGLINLKGHRLAGGCRASLYNGMPMEGVEKLIETMKQYEMQFK